MATEDISPVLIQRMANVLRTYVSGARVVDLADGRSIYAEAQDILGRLPAPVDPDIAEATLLRDEAEWNNDPHHVRILLKAIKRGRELERGA